MRQICVTSLWMSVLLSMSRLDHLCVVHSWVRMLCQATMFYWCFCFLFLRVTDINAKTNENRKHTEPACSHTTDPLAWNMMLKASVYWTSWEGEQNMYTSYAKWVITRKVASTLCVLFFMTFCPSVPQNEPFRARVFIFLAKGLISDQTLSTIACFSAQRGELQHQERDLPLDTEE